MSKRNLLLILTILVLSSTLSHATLDLKWRSPLTFTPASPTEGDTVTFSCRLKSDGAASSSVRVILKIDGTYQTGITIRSMTADEFKVINLTWTAVAGTHRAEMIIDPRDTIVENPTNNSRAVSLTVAAARTPVPDLLWVSTAVTSTPTEVIVGTVTGFGATVKCQGAPADDIKIVVRVDGSKVHDTVIPHLDAGQSMPLNFPSVWMPTAGAHTVAMVIDPAGTITESDETNNRLASRIEVRGLGEIEERDHKADVFWTDKMKASHTVITPGVNVTFTGKLKTSAHMRSDIIGMVQVNFEVDGEFVESKNINTLNIGSEHIVTFNWIAKKGKHTAVMKIDPMNRVAEENESNNDLTKVVFVTDTARSILSEQKLKLEPNIVKSATPFFVMSETNCKNNEDKEPDLEIINAEITPHTSPTKKILKFSVRNNGMKCVNLFQVSVRNQFNQFILQILVRPEGAKRYALTALSKRDLAYQIDSAAIERFSQCTNRESSIPREVPCTIIDVAIDPGNLIPESNELNNEATDLEAAWPPSIED